MNFFMTRCLALALALAPALAFAQWTSQTLVLRPGWNSVFLEIQPEPQACDALFAGLPVESVWDFNRSADSPQFVQDPSTLIPGALGWLTWFPPNHPLASRTSLFILRDGRPYLIKMADSAQPVNLLVTGKPSLRRPIWQSGGLNFAGFHVGTTGPTFRDLFAGEAGLTNQPVYALDAAGAWRQLINLSTTRPIAGQAYWIRCVLPAQRAGTIQVEPASIQGLNFPGNATENSLRIRNTSLGPRNISVRVLPSDLPPAGQPALAGPVPLEYWRENFAATNFNWEPFSSPLTFSALPVGQEWNIRLGLRRAGASPVAPGTRWQSLLEVSDDLGTRWLVPVNADPLPATSSSSELASLAPSPYAGLWIGDAVLRAVSQPAHLANPAFPRPAGGEFTFRLIVHVDSAGVARLLQHVFLVRKPPIVAPDPENPDFKRIIEPGRTIVASDEALIPAIVGDGEIVGRRVSSAAFGFKQPLPLAGGHFGTGTLTAGITLSYEDPLNPFTHVFHPDHNNLDERFEQKVAEGKESFTVTRSLSLEFTVTDPDGLNPPGWGDSEVGGIYREAISGIHRHTIHVSGRFRLVRASSTATLNQ